MYNIGRVSWSCLNEVIKLAPIGLLFILPSSYCEMQKTMNILIWYWQIDILQNPIGYFPLNAITSHEYRYFWCLWFSEVCHTL